MTAAPHCRKGQIHPTTGLLYDCTCPGCDRRSRELTYLEALLNDVVVELREDREWSPQRIVDEISRVTPEGSLAAELVTIELICHASFWLSRVELRNDLVEVDALADALPDNGEMMSEGGDFEMIMGGFHPGTTLPGWLGEHDATEDRMDDVRRGVVDAVAALELFTIERFASGTQEQPLAIRIVGVGIDFRPSAARPRPSSRR